MERKPTEGHSPTAQRKKGECRGGDGGGDASVKKKKSLPRGNKGPDAHAKFEEE